MSSKPENQFIARVHKSLKRWQTYHEKNHNVYRAGTPDVFYSGSRSYLWVEYKYLVAIPVRKNTPVKPALSDQQLRWLQNRSLEGRNVAVIIGCSEGGVALFTYEEWRNGLFVDAFRSRLRTVTELADLIYEKCGAGSYRV